MGKDALVARKAILEWYATASNAEWRNFGDLKATFNSADYVGDGKVVFDVGGNKYRIVGLVGFRTGRIFILFVGTHAEYDAVDVDAL
jgi:mRNA interferase HigB